MRIPVTDREKRALWLVLSDAMTMRSFLATSLLDEMTDLCGELSLDLIVVSGQKSADFSSSAIDMQQFAINPPEANGWEGSRLRRAIRSYVARSAAFRFDHISGFKKHRRKRQIDRSTLRTHRALLTLDDHRPWYLGFPAAGSRFLLDGLVRFRQSSVLTSSAVIEAMFSQAPPALVIAASCQAPSTFDWLRVARARGVPVVGSVSSWDNLTLKGPVGVGFQEYWVWTKLMEWELKKFHGIDASRIVVTGSPLFDTYHEERSQGLSEHVDRELALPEKGRVILLAAYSARLGQGEPSIAQHIADGISEGRYGEEEVTLVIRSHPADFSFLERFSSLADHPKVRLYVTPSVRTFDLKEQRNDLAFLHGLMARADLVACGSGTIALEAVCLDKPVINLRFDGREVLPLPISARSHFDSDHYQCFLGLNATSVVDSFDELDHEIVAALNFPAGRSQARAEARRVYAEWDSVPSASSEFVGRMRKLLAGQADGR